MSTPAQEYDLRAPSPTRRLHRHLPGSCVGGDLLVFMRLCYILLCSEASVGIMNAALVHQPDPSSHQTDRERRMVTEVVRTHPCPELVAQLPPFLGRVVEATCWPSCACAASSCAAGVHRSIWLHAEHLEVKGGQISFPRSKGDLKAPSPSPPSRAGRSTNMASCACAASACALGGP